eukprot:Nitzschia sp. Nitz4//scaffold53_size117307//115309//117659//NITZ4_003787-RA/size117307-augustus-gene-0.95-mRNA-1//1//CDS//3329554256//6916//frame0
MKTETAESAPVTPDRTTMFAPDPIEDDDESSNVGSSTESKDAPRSGAEEVAIAKAEDLAVFRIRLAVAVFLILCTIGVATAVYKVTAIEETKVFEDELYDFSIKALSSVVTALGNSVGMLDAFAVSIVSYTRDVNQTWPFIEIPDSSVRMSKVLTATNGVAISFLPKVLEEERAEWDVFSVERGPRWVDENLKIQEIDPNFHGNELEGYSVGPMFCLENISEVPIHFPHWQQYPTATSLSPYNFDSGTTPHIVRNLQSGRFRLSEIPNGENTDPAGYNAWLTEYVGDSFATDEPVSEFIYPISQAMADRPNSLASDAGDASEIIGLLWTNFFWRHKFEGILPQGTKGIVMVTHNTCNQSFTYEINGPEAVFLGHGDHHDPAYDHLAVEATISDLVEEIGFLSVYSGLLISTEQGECDYYFRAYPSKSFESYYKTANPWIYTVVTVSIFLFTFIVFGAYDFLVERRQSKVMSTAVKSSAIVSSLFPSNVRDRLYDLEGEKKGHHHLTSDPRSSISSNIAYPENFKMAAGEGEDREGRPIADLFPETTVMFADLAGFTKWSSTREPSQVFILLEHLYGAFDAIAARRRIFKVETIGDCYVAVAGLPEPRADHAVVMAKFAHDCNAKMTKLMSHLSVTLGPDTEYLCMRFGLNSGPVTAGVLRGQKSRFQLFGDTVNTASRMETTGKRQSIHGSQATADELIKFGKEHWLQAREDAVEVKGKGRLQTYWIVPAEAAMASSSDGDEILEHGSSKDSKSSS